MNKKNTNDLVLFIHIPKTAGTTLRSIIIKEYHPKIWYLYTKYREKPLNRQSIIEKIKKNHHLKCICGHIGFGIWSPYTGESVLTHYQPERPITYISMLRDPIDQVISHYYFLQTIFLPRNDPNHILLKTSFEEFIKMKQYTNLQTLYIAGGSLDLQMAKENITKHFKVVGITERFNESVFLMKKELGWKNIHYKKQNITPNRPSKDTLSRHVIDMIKKYNQLDIELYHYARQLLERKIASLDLQSKEELNQFVHQINKGEE